MDLFDARIRIPDAVLHQQLDAETILLHLTAEHYYGLDEVGSRVWQLVDRGSDGASIVAALVEEYDVDEATLRADVARLLDDLLALGLIEVEPGPPA